MRRPVPGFVVADARIPQDPYAAGRRAMRFAAHRGSAVIAPADGRIAFAGSVAGTGYVTIAAAGAEVRVGAVAAQVAVGDHVIAGATIGTAADAEVALSLVAGGAGPPDPAPDPASVPAATAYRDPAPCLRQVRTIAVDPPGGDDSPMSAS